MVTIKDVAKRANVSIKTVSRVINNSDEVTVKTQRRVMKAVEELGYYPNMSARLLVSRKYIKAIGLIVPGIASPFYSEIVDVVEYTARQNGYDLMLYTTRIKEQKESILFELFSGSRVNGILVITPRYEEEYFAKFKKSSSIPFVMIDHRNAKIDVPSVEVDNVQGGYLATKYLLELGHRRIGLITGVLQIQSSRNRVLGYEKALQEFGIEKDTSLIKEGDFFQESGYKLTKEWIEENELPTAIFASNDMIAFGCYNAIRDSRLRIPDDISVIGFDNIKSSSFAHPPLTTVDQFMHEMGAIGIEMLLKLIDRKQPENKKVIIQPKLVIRKSCKAHKKR